MTDQPMTQEVVTEGNAIHSVPEFFSQEEVAAVREEILRTKIGEGQVPVDWPEFEQLVYRMAMPLKENIRRFGSFDFVMAIKHGAGTLIAQLERVLEHELVGYAKLKRREEIHSDPDTPPPRIVYFPSPENFRDKRVLIVDEVWETGKSVVRTLHEIEQADPRSLTTAVLHFKPGCNRSASKPDIYAAIVDPRYRLYPWELLQLVIEELWRRRLQILSVSPAL